MDFNYNGRSEAINIWVHCSFLTNSLPSSPQQSQWSIRRLPPHHRRLPPPPQCRRSRRRQWSLRRYYKAALISARKRVRHICSSNRWRRPTRAHTAVGSTSARHALSTPLSHSKSSVSALSLSLSLSLTTPQVLSFSLLSCSLQYISVYYFALT